jgi:hypothetical protein
MNKLISFIEEIKSDFGGTITKKQFEALYIKTRSYFVEKYGEPERGFISVMGFGTKCRDELRKTLVENGITVCDPPKVDEYNLKRSGFNRLAEIQKKLL